VPSAELVYTETYVDCLVELPSDALLEKVHRREDQLALFPDQGELITRASLVSRFGSGCRKLVVGSYLMIYRHEGAQVILLGLVWGGLAV